MALLLLTGCRNDADAAPVPTSDPPSSSQAPATSEATSAPSAAPEPSPASSAGPATNIRVPIKPALADENTPEGLEAFTAYWFELLSYSYITDDWQRFDETTDPGCRTCSSIRSAVNELYGQGRWVRGAEVRVISFDTAFELTTSGSITAYVENRQAKIEYFDKDGSVLRVVPAQESPSFDVVNALYEAGEWIVLDYGAPEGTSQ